MPPPANNENQGLKIAVACFVMLSVILAVTTYFGFKNYAESEKHLAEKTKEAADEKKANDDVQRLLIDVKDKVGVPKVENTDIPKALTKEREDLIVKATTSADDARKAIAEWKNAGGVNNKLDELTQTIDTILSGMKDPGQSLLSTAVRQQELLNNQAMIALMMSLQFQTTRKILEDTNGINAQKLDVETQAYQTAKKDLEDEHNKHEQDRQQLMAKVDGLQSDLNKTAAENATLKNQIAQMQDDFNKKNSLLLANLKELKDQTMKTATVLDKKDGTLTFVDYTRGEVRTTLTRRTGAKEQMELTIFDKDAPGLPTDKPKGKIELIQVGNNGSIGRIIKTESSINPLRAGDQVYSPSWDPDRPIEFALIGKIDINRDSRDDRADLKRMIEASGGKVVYDLPPPGIGPETGKITPRISWYVTDDRAPFYATSDRVAKMIGADDEAFLKKRSAAIDMARQNGVTPKPLERLLPELGYTFNNPKGAGLEASDKKAIQAIVNPKGKVGKIPTPEDDAEKKDEDAKPEGDQPAGDKPDAEKP